MINKITIKNDNDETIEIVSYYGSIDELAHSYTVLQKKRQ